MYWIISLMEGREERGKRVISLVQEQHRDVGWGGGGNESNGGEGRDGEKESHMPGARVAQRCGGGGGVMNLMEGRGEMGRKRVISLVQEQHRYVGGGGGGGGG